jgi:hypothetical protein
MPILTASVSSAVTGVCHGAECMSWAAGSTPLRISLWTERTQMPSRVAASEIVDKRNRDAFEPQCGQSRHVACHRIRVADLLCRGPAGDDPDCINIDVSARLLGQRPHTTDVTRRFLERVPRDIVENSASQFSDRERLAGRRRAGIHDQRTRPAMGFGLGPHAL